jgi:hypothetical protein
MSTGRVTSHLSCKTPGRALRRELSAPLEAGRRKDYLPVAELPPLGAE